MKVSTSFSLILTILSFIAKAQIGTGEIPPGIKKQLDLSGLEALSFEVNQTYQAPADSKEPLHVGFSLDVNKDYFTHAIPFQIDDNTILWHIKLVVPEAQMLGLVFENFQLPYRDKLFIYEPTGNHFLGAFGSFNNRSHGVFSTQIIPGNTLIIEYQSQRDTDIDELPELLISEIIYIFRDAASDTIWEKSSGTCNVNINCPEGLLWQKQKRGVARILLRDGSNWFNCSGSLVNNTLEDGTPYFLTADHCGSQATEEDFQVWQFYFNHEYPGCTNAGNAPTNMSITGSTLLAKAPLQGGTDFKLLLLEEDIPDNWNPYFNGWSRATEAATHGVGIHHPSGDAKKISTFGSELISTGFSSGMTQGFWRLTWAETESGHGVTEGGSSGSPIFDQDGLIVGTLTGGSASCNSPNLPDFYGKFSKHWKDNGEENTTRLQPWLDPEEENPVRLFGYDPNLFTGFVNIIISPSETGIVTGAGYYVENEIVSLEAIPNEGYMFMNWTDTLGNELSVEEEFSFFMPQEDKYIVAVFKDFEKIVEQVFSAEKVLIYPNPAADKINVSIDDYFGIVNIKLINTLGNVVFEEPEIHVRGSITREFNFELFTLGLYFMKIESKDGTSIHKILINPG